MNDFICHVEVCDDVMEPEREGERYIDIRFLDGPFAGQFVRATVKNDLD